MMARKLAGSRAMSAITFASWTSRVIAWTSSPGLVQMRSSARPQERRPVVARPVEAALRTLRHVGPGDRPEPRRHGRNSRKRRYAAVIPLVVLTLPTTPRSPKVSMVPRTVTSTTSGSEPIARQLSTFPGGS